MIPSFLNARLDPVQIEVLNCFADSALAQTYYFTGGTALAGLYLHHRDSEDLDFFSEAPAGLEPLREPLKLEFSAFRMPRMRPLHLLGNLRVDPIEELYVNKLLAFVDRKEPNDDVDIYFLLQQASLPPLRQAMVAAEHKSSLRGLHYMLQRRLLDPSKALPPTTPPTTATEIAERFLQEGKRLVDASIEE